MSKDMNNLEAQNMQIASDNSISKDINELKQSLKSIDIKINLIDETLEKLLDILNTITVFIEDSSDGELDLNEGDNEDWTPYDDRNFAYEEEEDDDGDSYFQD